MSEGVVDKELLTFRPVHRSAWPSTQLVWSYTLERAGRKRDGSVIPVCGGVSKDGLNHLRHFFTLFFLSAHQHLPPE